MILQLNDLPLLVADLDKEPVDLIFSFLDLLFQCVNLFLTPWFALPVPWPFFILIQSALKLLILQLCLPALLRFDYQIVLVLLELLCSFGQEALLSFDSI